MGTEGPAQTGPAAASQTGARPSSLHLDGRGHGAGQVAASAGLMPGSLKSRGVRILDRSEVQKGITRLWPKDEHP